ncbi:MAG TPA: oligosaccharide flippase family protein, partial [Longimicrobiaceae bacterium]|nr:oligosaccharide flippase family protein [Longimicrobiaceae bacterium]
MSGIWPFRRGPGDAPAAAAAAGEAAVRPRAPLSHGIAFNLASVAVQVVLALVAVPLFARELGAARMGVLALVWTTIGYFSLLHLGVGRALIQSAAGRSEDREVAQLVWTSLLTVGAVAVLAALVLEVGAPLLVAEVLRVPPEMRAETARAFHLLALALPFVVSMPVLTGALEARYRFGTVSAVSAASTTLSYLAPLLVVHFTDGLVPLVATLGAVRVASWFAYLTLCFREVPALRRGPVFHRERMGPLLRFGGWTTVSGVVSPLMVYLDRFLVGGMVS